MNMTANITATTTFANTIVSRAGFSGGSQLTPRR
jgi:hypothetical protein